MNRVGLALFLVAFCGLPFVQAQQPTNEQVFSNHYSQQFCEVEKSLTIIDKDRRLMKPIYVSGDLAWHISGHIAQLVPSRQVIIVAAADGKLVILACGPENTWQPRHFQIDVEAERRFYNLAPEIPVVEETPKRKRMPKGAGR